MDSIVWTINSEEFYFSNVISIWKIQKISRDGTGCHVVVFKIFENLENPRK